MTADTIVKELRDAAERASPVRAARYRRAADRIEALEKALEPFAKFASHIAKEMPGWYHDDFTFADPLNETGLTMGDFIRALEAQEGK
jgi:hypothetical protein